MLIGQFIAATVFGAVIGVPMTVMLVAVIGNQRSERNPDNTAKFIAVAAVMSSGWLVALLGFPDAFANGFRPEHAFWLAVTVTPFVNLWFLARGQRDASR